jgi:hydrogenase nickel incorporation protein HypA/HybF
MHEIAIAQNILDIALDTAKKNKADKIVCIDISIGEFSCINPEALRFVLSCIATNSIAEEADIVISRIKQSDTVELVAIEVDE